LSRHQKEVRQLQQNETRGEGIVKVIAVNQKSFYINMVFQWDQLFNFAWDSTRIFLVLLRLSILKLCDL